MKNNLIASLEADAQDKANEAAQEGSFLRIQSRTDAYGLNIIFNSKGEHLAVAVPNLDQIDELVSVLQTYLRQVKMQ